MKPLPKSAITNFRSTTTILDQWGFISSHVCRIAPQSINVENTEFKDGFIRETPISGVTWPWGQWLEEVEFPLRCWEICFNVMGKDIMAISQRPADTYGISDRLPLPQMSGLPKSGCPNSQGMSSTLCASVGCTVGRWETTLPRFPRGELFYGSAHSLKEKRCMWHEAYAL